MNDALFHSFMCRMQSMSKYAIKTTLLQYQGGAFNIQQLIIWYNLEWLVGPNLDILSYTQCFLLPRQEEILYYWD